MQKINYPFIQETIYRGKATSGLEYYIVPKTGFSSVYYELMIPFGYLNNKYRINSVTKTLPLGVAHFLEHQMFDSDNAESIISKFTSLGAEANAYTTSDITAYTASSIENHKEVLNMLLNYVQNPRFTPQTIEKERGIIEQELLMYLDNANSVLLKGLLKQLYKLHPIKEEGIGSKSSIAEISYQHLQEVYSTFYHPSKMKLVVTGGINPQEINDIIIENQKELIISPLEKTRHLIPKESLKVKQAKGSIEMEISTPKIIIGFKIPPLQYFGKNKLKTYLLSNIIMEDMLGISSSIYQEMLDKKIFDTGYFSYINFETNAGYIVIGADSKNPSNFEEYVISIIPKLQKHLLTKETFDLKMRSLSGSILRNFDNLEYIAEVIREKIFFKNDILQNISLLSTFNYQEAIFLQKYFCTENMSTFIIWPKNKK